MIDGSTWILWNILKRNGYSKVDLDCFRTRAIIRRKSHLLSHCIVDSYTNLSLLKTGLVGSSGCVVVEYNLSWPDFPPWLWYLLLLASLLTPDMGSVNQTPSHCHHIGISLLPSLFFILSLWNYFLFHELWYFYRIQWDLQVKFNFPLPPHHKI